jgi:5-enolpyruvylshikimate-3-phosphate synthase
MPRNCNAGRNKAKTTCFIFAVANNEKIMSSDVAIQPIRLRQAVVRPPGSKSITNRALVCAALADGRSTLTGALDCDDTRVMLGALKQLGLTVRHDPAAATMEVTGCGGVIPARQADLYVGNSGTTVRFLTAARPTCMWATAAPPCGS